MVLVVVSGWTGAGKSTIASALASQFSAAIASFDWLMSGLRAFPEVWQFVESPADRQREVGWALMSRVIEQHLRHGTAVVADLVARDPVVGEWRTLAERYDTPIAVVECVCADEAIHRSRVEGRERNIPGWYELTWDRVERGRAAYRPLSGPKLVLDAVHPLAANISAACEYVNAQLGAR